MTVGKKSTTHFMKQLLQMAKHTLIIDQWLVTPFYCAMAIGRPSLLPGIVTATRVTPPVKLKSNINFAQAQDFWKMLWIMVPSLNFHGPPIIVSISFHKYCNVFFKHNS